MKPVQKTVQCNVDLNELEGYENDFCGYIDKVRNQRYVGIKYTLLVSRRKIYERKQGGATFRNGNLLELLNCFRK